MEATIQNNRRRFAAMLRTLDVDARSAPTLCRQFTVQDLVGHLTFTWRVSDEELWKRMTDHGGDFDAASVTLARELGDRPWEELVADIEAHANDVQRPQGTQPEDLLLEWLVHPLDVSIPAGLPWETDAAAAGPALQHLVTPAADHYRPGVVIDGLRFVATDQNWTWGAGPEVCGPSEALLLVLAGRAAGIASSEGPGLAQLRERIEAAAVSG